MKKRIFAEDVESYKEFLVKYFTSNPEYITDWVRNNVLSKEKIGTDKMLAFFAAQSEILQNFIEEGKTQQPTALLNLFNSLNNPTLVKLELDLFIKVLTQTKPHLSEHSEDYGKFLAGTISGFNSLNEAYHDDNIDSKLQQASELIGQICDSE